MGGDAAPSTDAGDTGTSSCTDFKMTVRQAETLSRDQSA
jgi:hypothetical protein